ncbi:MAG: hypothetical protein HDR80_03740 [Bacteroides sp.]|nr:hypothetical protein [Bacteroides sp.]
MWTIFKFTNLIYLLVSSYIWFAFLLPRNYIPLIVSGLFLMCFAFGHFRLRVTPRAYGILGVLVLYSVYSLYILDFNYALTIFFSYLPAVLLFTLEEQLQKDLLGYVTKWFSIMMGVSIVFFGLSFLVPLPSSLFLPYELSDSYLTFDNYYFFMKTNMYLSENAGIFRFGGPFLEPGHQSLICALLLFANRFRMKRQPLMWILVVSVVLSFSLAGYLILFVGWAMAKIKNIYTMAGIVFIVGGTWLFCTVVWNGGQNPVNKLIFERLEFDKDKGIKGNNRTLRHTDYFFRECVSDGTAVLGVRSLKADKLKIAGAGYKIFILRNGFIGLAFVMMLYLMLIPPGCNLRYGTSFFLLIVMIFLQRAYPTWYSWLLPYVLGLGVMRWNYDEGAGEEEEADPEELPAPESSPLPQGFPDGN